MGSKSKHRSFSCCIAENDPALRDKLPGSTSFQYGSTRLGRESKQNLVQTKPRLRDSAWAFRSNTSDQTKKRSSPLRLRLLRVQHPLIIQSGSAEQLNELRFRLPKRGGRLRFRLRPWSRRGSTLLISTNSSRLGPKLDRRREERSFGHDRRSFGEPSLIFAGRQMTIRMSRRCHPVNAPTKVAAVVPAITGGAERRMLIVGPVLAGHTIGGEAIIAVASCVEATVYTRTTQLVVRAVGEHLQLGPILGSCTPSGHV